MKEFKEFDELLKAINETPAFQEFVQRVLLKNMPAIPAYNAIQDNTSEWMRASLQREGYKLCLDKLKVKHD